jgi:DNA mismatch repair protein MutL
MVNFVPQITLILTDIIQLLPDHIANQIAAGEVIQRPASAVKELLENAVDAGADEIRLIIQDAGKQLVQVIDNGKGMSELDARMAFERHATSKIRNIDDLFRIKTMGFRGEALASIAAVAQVELKTRREEDPAGTFLEIENSRVQRQEPVAFNPGTSIAMKNLFFNVPARRNFLKSNASELRHIIDEFIRVSMAFPEIFFSMHSNGQEVYHLEKGSLKQRIVQLLGNNYNAKLVAVQEQTDYLNILGFVGKPETARKTRGDQYIFVNNRFIKSAYLNHAITQAFSEMIPSDSFPAYVLFIDLDPAQLDVNVHPTKQEIKFEDEKIVYAFVQAAVKHALAQFNITPTLDFELDAGIQQLDALRMPPSEGKQEQTRASNLYQEFTQKGQAHLVKPNTPSSLENWRDFFEPVSATQELQSTTASPVLPWKESINFQQLSCWQLNQTYVLFQVEGLLWILHQQYAHERILYEKFTQAMHGQPLAVQRLLFPIPVEFSAPDAALLEAMIPDLLQLGFQLEPFGKQTYVIQGTPADLKSGQEKQHIEQLLERVKHFSADLKLDQRERILRSLAQQQSTKPGQSLTQEEMQSLTAELFACLISSTSPSGKPALRQITSEAFDRFFERLG